jgi:outer membrane biosynthesis protein TonB
MERPIPVAVRPAYPSVPSKQSPASARPPSVTPSVVPSGAQAISDEEFAAIQHKEQVRLHLKARLSYPDRVGEGVVRLRVVLGPEGRLLKAEGLEASDPRLMNQVVQDAESAAPYPVFPARLRHRQVTYEFLVRYQPE